MSVNDPSLQLSRAVNVEGRSVLLERRLGLLPDHLLDTSARRYAVMLRLGESTEVAPPMSSYTLARDVTRVR